MKITAIVQARMGSTRFPGKSMESVGGLPLIGHVLARLRLAKSIGGIVVATTLEDRDDVLASYATTAGARCYRGSSHDVLDRYYKAARQETSDIVVRITADDPFKDPDVIDAMVAPLLANSEVDYSSNTIVPTYPEGLDVEAFRFTALEKAWLEARLDSEREHVTPYIWKNPALFRIVSNTLTTDLSGYRWTLDYPEDFDFARAVYQHLGPGYEFKMNDILELVTKHPEIGALNSKFFRNEGYIKSIAAEQGKL